MENKEIKEIYEWMQEQKKLQKQKDFNKCLDKIKDDAAGLGFMFGMAIGALVGIGFYIMLSSL